MYQTSRNMRKVVMQTAEPVYSGVDTDMLVKILVVAYMKAYLEQVDANTTQLNSEERPQLLRILNNFEDLFDGTL